MKVHFKRCSSALFFMFCALVGLSQSTQIDSITLYVKANNDTANHAKTFENIKKRIHCTGLNYRSTANKNTISITVPSNYDTVLLPYLLKSKAQFGVYETYDNYYLYPMFQFVNIEIVKKGYFVDTSKNATEITKQYPLFALLIPATNERNELLTGPVIGYCLEKDTAVLMQILIKTKIKKFFPDDLRFMWSKQDIKGWYSLFATKEPFTYNPIETPMIAVVKIDKNEKAQKNEIFIYLKKSFHPVWDTLTKSNIGKALAITIDNKVYSYPTVQNQISGGGIYIMGNWKREMLECISCILKYPIEEDLDIYVKKE